MPATPPLSDIMHKGESRSSSTIRREINLLNGYEEPNALGRIEDTREEARSLVVSFGFWMEQVR